MLTTIGMAAIGLGVLYFGGEFLVRGASSLASIIGVSSLAIGLTVVALGTSAPELAVSISAAMSGANDIAVGNVIGSNIANIALIIGLAALIRPMKVETKIVRIDAPIMILASLALVLALSDSRVSRLEGMLFVAALTAYIAFTFREAQREAKKVQEVFAPAVRDSGDSAATSGLFVVVGLGSLVGGGQLLVSAAVRLATLLGISQTVIGLTIVAVGTSLPELSTSLIASRRGHGDIAIGNVLGSNIFNILGILGLTAVVRPLSMGGITWGDLGAMILLACIASIFLYTRLQLERFEGSLLVICFALYIGWLFAA